MIVSAFALKHGQSFFFFHLQIDSMDFFPRLYCSACLTCSLPDVTRVFGSPLRSHHLLTLRCTFSLLFEYESIICSAADDFVRLSEGLCLLFPCRDRISLQTLRDSVLTFILVSHPGKVIDFCEREAGSHVRIHSRTRNISSPAEFPFCTSSSSRNHDVSLILFVRSAALTVSSPIPS